MADEAQKLEAELLAAFSTPIEEPANVSSLPAVAPEPASEPTPPTALPPVAASVDPISTKMGEPRPEDEILSALKPDEMAAKPIPFPKRAREPDESEETDAKRVKTEHTEHTEHDILDFDVGAMLQNALGELDDPHFHLPLDALGGSSEDVIMTLPTDTSAPAPTLPVEKVEEKLMKASENSLYMLRSMSLPLLGNVAVQIFLRLSQQARRETEALLGDPDSEFTRTYETLNQIFVLLRKAFSDSTPLLFPDDLGIADSEDRETVRIANLASVGVSTFGANDVPVEEMHDNFYNIFVQEDGEYKAELTDLFLALKSLAYAQHLHRQSNSGEGLPEVASSTLDQYFPPDFKEQLTPRHSEGLLHAAEEDLVARVMERRAVLLASITSEEQKRSASEEVAIENFKDSIGTFFRGHLPVVVDYAEKYGVNIPLNEEQDPNDILPADENQQHDELAALIQSATSDMEVDENSGSNQIKQENGADDHSMSLEDGLNLGELIAQTLSNQEEVGIVDGLPRADQNGLSEDAFDATGLASLIAESMGSNVSNGAGNGHAYNAASYPSTLHATNGVHSHSAGALASQNPMQAQPYLPYQQHAPANLPSVPGDSLPPNQTQPTQVLYDRARQAAVSKSSSSARREGIHSTRRPWSPEEERALMTGLDMVKGPHWSQILALFGANGTMSDILRDRTQVQLKDKARNLKLFFLKTESEMPYYLQSVTGELKTRAPGQAARKEAEEKARQNSEEEQARIQGIMTLAGGLQHKQPQGKTNSSAHPTSMVSAHASLATPGRPSASTTGPNHRGSVLTAGHASGTSSPVPLAAASVPTYVKTEPSEQDLAAQITSHLASIRPSPAPSTTQPRPQNQPITSQVQAQSQHRLQYQQQQSQQSQLQQGQQGHQQPSFAQVQAQAQAQRQQQQQQMQQQHVQQSQLHTPHRPQQAQSSTQQTSHPSPQQRQQVQPQQQIAPQTAPRPAQLQNPNPNPSIQSTVGARAQIQTAPSRSPQQTGAQPAPSQPSMAPPSSTSTPNPASSAPHPASAALAPTPPTNGVPPTASSQAPAVTSQASTSASVQPTTSHQIPGLPQLPPNHHTSNDSAQEFKLMETLQAALSAGAPAINGVPPPTATTGPVVTPRGTG